MSHINVNATNSKWYMFQLMIIRTMAKKFNYPNINARYSDQYKQERLITLAINGTAVIGLTATAYLGYIGSKYLLSKHTKLK